MSPDSHGFFEGVLALWHRLSAASSRPARGIAYADSEAEWNPPAGASRDPQGLRERPGCVVGEGVSSTLHSSDALGGWRGRAVEVAVRRRGACNYPGDRGGAARPDVAFGLPSFPAGVSFVGARRCLPRGAGSRWVAAEPRPRRRGSRRILALSTDPRAVVPVESRARRPELPRRRLVLAPRGGSSREVPALGGLRRSHGRAVAVPDGSWPCPRILGRWCRSRVARAVQSCRADGSFWPPAVARGRRRGRGCGWIWSVAWPQSPPPTPCRPAAVRPTRAHLVRLLAAVIPLLPTGSLAPDPPLACHRPPPRWPCQAAARRRGSVWWPVAPPTRPCVAPQLPAQSTSTPSGCVPLPSRCCPPAPCPLLEPAAPPTAAGRCAGACAPPAGCSPLPAR